MTETVLLVGTKKGLWIGRSDAARRKWEWPEPEFLMQGIYGLGVDTRGPAPRLLVSGTSEHWGPGVYRSDDLGRTWSEDAGCSVRFPADLGSSVERVWQIQPGSAAEPDVVWAGTQPSALFRSEDRGETFTLIRSLWDHPHRPQWQAGFGGQAIHTTVPHPTDPQQLTVAMSTGGVYRSADGGGSWAPANVGIKAYFFPDPWPEFGQCVHKVARDAVDADRLFAQNHHGVYRSDDAGTTWVSIADPLPADFGFAMVTHPSKAATAYSFPLVADGERLAPERKCRVFRTTDGGTNWEPLSEGLPQQEFYGIVLRDALCVDDSDRAGVYLGTRTGSVFASRDEGDTWAEVARDLPDVLCVRAAVVA